MERTLTPEERIRRAEEIYNRRKMQTNGVRVTSTAVNSKGKTDFSLFKKMVLQIIICLLIYFIYYLIQNTNYIFSEDVLNKTKEILSYDVNIEKLYNDFIIYTNGIREKVEGKSVDNNNNENENQEDSKNEQNVTDNPVTEENIGGAVETPVENTTQEQNEQENQNLSQMEIDANDIKAKYTLIQPVTGTITSRFGLRNPTTPTVPKNHTGIDIAANTGTVIQAALDGVVEIASSEGDYRKSFKNSKR